MSVAARALALLIAWVTPGLAWAHASTSNSVLFDREIVRILEARCVMCHAEGGPAAPFETYEQSWLQRQGIHDATLARRMPPWPAIPGYGEFVNANSLTLREQRFIVSWVEGLGPRNDGVVFLNVEEGDAATRGEVRARPQFDRWTLGEPEQTVALLPVRDPASARDGPLRVQRALIDLGVAAGRELRALEYRPKNRRATRAVVFTVESTGQWLATWTPWYGVRELPEGAAFRLPANAKIAAEIYVDGAGEPDELGELGLHFAERPGLFRPTDTVLAAATDVPAGATDHRLRAETALATDTTVLALWPQLPSGTRSLEVRALHPNGRSEVLLLAMTIPLDWPTPYIYREPIRLPRGTRVALTAYVANDMATAARKQLALTLSTLAR